VTKTVLFVFLGIAAIMGLVFVGLSFGRRITYAEGRGPFPGTGVKYLTSEDAFVVRDNTSFEESVVPVDQLEKYANPAYDIRFVPGQTVIAYIVGEFREWENISNSDDYYVYLNTGEGGITKIRTTIATTADYDTFTFSTKTVFRVEPLLEYIKQGETNEPQYNLPIINPGSTYGRRLLRKGDMIAAVPLYSKDGSVSRDNDGYVVVRTLVLRRYFGIDEINLESYFLR